MTETDPKAVMINVLKGGLGKSTTAKNTANELGKDSRVLLIDVDDNGHLSKHLGFKEEFNNAQTLADLINDNPDVGLQDLIYPTKYNFDFMPSTDKTDQVEAAASGEININAVLKKYVTDPLLGSAYDYILFDTPANRSVMTRNAAVASDHLIMPLSSGEEGKDGLEATMQRIYIELNKVLPGGINLLAIVPNKINNRIDIQTKDRELLEDLNTRQIGNTNEYMHQYLPNFARIPQEVWKAIDDGNLQSYPKPGIRKDAPALDNPQPIHEVAPESPTIECFQELAQIIKQGEIQRDQDITERLLREHGGVPA